MTNNKYVRVMDGLKSNASGEKFKLDEVIISKLWNPKENDPEKMGGFNFSTLDKILRFIFRGDTIYDVVVPDDADIILVDDVKGIYRANKILVTNPRKITEDMVIDIYKNSNLTESIYFQCIYCLLFRKYINASKYIIKDIVNKDNVEDAIKEFELTASRGNDGKPGIFNYDELFPDAKEIYNILINIKNNI